MLAVSRHAEAGTARIEPEPWTVGLISQPFEILSPEMRCADVFDWFMRRPQIPAAAIVNGQGTILGLVNRLRFLAHYAQRYIPELYGPRPIISLANRAPLIVDEQLAVTALGERLTEIPDALHECFVITRAGNYLGIGTGDALVRAKVQLLVRQEGELRSAMERALEASKTKSNFLALMSHELRTPLNAIIGFSEVLKTELFGPIGSQKYADYARHVHDAGTHLLQLINDILDLSKAESGKMELSREAVDIPGLAADCIRLVEGKAAEGGLRLVTAIPPTLPAVDGDPLRLKQILLNLLSNAIKFTPRGGSVTVRAAHDPAGLSVAVIDTGIGIAPEMIPIALEPFRQISSPMARNAGGSGLGLSLVKSLTEQQGGVFHIESVLGEGTVASLNFPPHLLKWTRISA